MHPAKRRCVRAPPVALHLSISISFWLIAPHGWSSGHAAALFESQSALILLPAMNNNASSCLSDHVPSAYGGHWCELPPRGTTASPERLKDTKTIVQFLIFVCWSRKCQSCCMLADFVPALVSFLRMNTLNRQHLRRLISPTDTASQLPFNSPSP